MLQTEPRVRQSDRARGEGADENRTCGDATARAPDAHADPKTAMDMEELDVEEDEYEDRGDFKLRQENYVRPNFPPLYDDKPPAPFPDALKDTRRPVHDQELSTCLASVR